MSVVHISKISRLEKLVRTSWTPWSALRKSGELWARAPVLRPVPSQANHSNDGKHSKTRLHELRVPMS